MIKTAFYAVFILLKVNVYSIENDSYYWYNMIKVGVMMKRWIFFVITAILIIVSFFLYQPYFAIESSREIFALIVIFFALVSLFVGLYITLNQRNHQKISTLQNRLSMWSKLSYHISQAGDEIFNELPIGMIAVDEQMEIKWSNPHAQTIFGHKVNGKSLEDIHEKMYENASTSKINFVIEKDQKFYDVIYRPEYRFFYLFDVTNREQVLKQYQDQIPALGLIFLDNLDEALSVLDVSEQSMIKGDYLAAINDWAGEFDCYLKSYDDDKIFLITDRKNLNLMIDNKFDLLDKVRQISAEQKVRVSISMGIASWDIPYEEIGVYTQNAVELAEKRGGDQVVVNIQDQKIAYFGAKSDASIKNSRVGVRINAQTIRDFIEKSSDVYIMGHHLSDMDAFGAMLACFHMTVASKKQAYIIFDEDKLDNTVLKVYKEVKEQLSAIKVITSAEALQQIHEQSLLIVVDSQSPKIVMAPEVLEKTENLIVIDHHRVGEERFNAIFSIIEPSASSSIELMMELLGFYNLEEEMKITPIEASIMYGGLIVDTSNFIFRTSSRTFETASRLKELGADATLVKTWLRRDMMRIMEINRLLDQVEIVLNKFAFIVTSDIYDDRVLLAQVSEAALEINGIDAAFTIARIDDHTVAVSARSLHEINVQILMEMMGGGGHFNSAAVQLSDTSIQKVYEELRQYVELEYGGGEKMKVILTTDIKGKGKKDQIIEVANGYGQFLLNQKKAVLASEDNLESLAAEQQKQKEAEQRHLDLMKKLKSEIDGKQVVLEIQIGKDGKQFGSITTKQIAEAFQETHGILIDKKKLELQSEINSIGIYTAFVQLHKDIKAQFEVKVIEK